MDDSLREWWYSDEGRCPIRRLTEHVLKYNPDLLKDREYSQEPELRPASPLQSV